MSSISELGLSGKLMNSVRILFFINLDFKQSEKIEVRQNLNDTQHTHFVIVFSIPTKNHITRWTFFRVKLVFEYEFEISWSLGPWDLWTPGPWNPWTLGLLDLFPPPTPPHTYILLPPPISSSYSPPLVWFGYGGGGGGG